MTEPFADDRNVYAPPSSAVVDVVAEQETPPLYVVAPAKCMLLYFATVGLYAFYWFWRHWSLLNRREGLGLWPLARGVFHILFAHSLFKRIDLRLQQAQPAYRWSAMAHAWAFVVFSVAGLVFDELASRDIAFPLTDALALMTLLPTGYALLHAQKAANAACADPAGVRNASLSAANYAWLILGFLLWAAVAIGLWTMLSGEVE